MAEIKDCHVLDFAEWILYNIYKSNHSPIDFSLKEGELIRFDDTTRDLILDDIESHQKINERNALIFVDILKKILLVDIPGERPPRSDYTKYIDAENITYTANDSVLLYVYNSTLLLLISLRHCFGELACIEAIENFLFNGDYYDKKYIDKPLEDIKRFLFMVYKYIFNKCCKNSIIQGKRVNSVILTLLKTRFYSEVYLLISGHIIDQNIEERHWVFGIQQAGRFSKDYCLSLEDRRSFQFYPDYIKKLTNEIDSLRDKTDEESIRKRKEMEYIHYLITLARRNVKYGSSFDQDALITHLQSIFNHPDE